MSACNAQNSEHSDMKENTKNNNSKVDKDHGDHKHTNLLIHESSPYLLQHAHNPVNWHPWGDEALQKAKDENKLLLISVGYAACHWCHVMEHESFEDEEVANYMNEHFVPIKIDREERPDIDQIYMNACHLINQRGGWPLNALALADGKPFFAGTYYQKDKWLKLLQYFVNLKETEPQKIQDQANQITEGVQQSELISLNPEKLDFTTDNLNEIFNKWIGRIDFNEGGRKGAPKFPMPNNYNFLLRYHHLTKNEKALEATLKTLDKMADGGIYDHLGGGFARYSVDGFWKVPHFEKMTYDNAQLVSLYSEAYRLSNKKLYKDVVYQTLEYTEREMTSKEGGFYSSLDADSEGVEGKFYVWEESEIDSLLGENSDLFKAFYSVNKVNEWEHKNILYRTKEASKIADKFKISEEELYKRVEAGKKILMAERDTRIRPGLDDKILTSWNALMIKAYVDAYKAFGETKFLDAAVKNANFLLKKATDKNYKLNRNYKGGKSSINAFLDDYSLMIESLVSLYQATFDEQWLQHADKYMKYTIEHFYDKESGMFFYTSDQDNPLIARKMEVSDNVIPGSNSSIGMGLFLLGTYLYKDEYKQMAKQMLINVKDNVLANGPFFSHWCNLMYHFVADPYEVAIVGSEWSEMRAEFDKDFHPNILLLGGNKEGEMELLKNKSIEGQTTIYVCRNKSCKLPVTEVSKAIDLIK